jgi:O-antigen/teichoic acid export membrane protein
MFDIVFKHIKTIFSAFVVTSIINVSASVYFARILGPEVFYVFIASQLFREIVGIPFAASFNLPLYHFRKRIAYVSTRLSALILVSFFLYLSLMLILLNSGKSFIPNIDKNVVMALSIVFALNAFGSLSTTILQARDEYKLVSNINIAATMFSTLASLVIIAFFQSVYVLVVKEIVYKALLWMGCSYRVGSLAFILPNFKIKKKVMKVLLFQSYRIWTINFLDIVSTRLDKYLVNIFYIPVVLSNLQQARYYAELPSTLIMPLTPLFYEKLSDPIYSLESKKNLVRQISIVLIALGLCCGIGLYMLGPAAILFLLGEDWALAAEFSRGLSFYIALLPYANFIKIVAYYRKQNRSVAFAQIVQICAFVISFYWVHLYYTMQMLPVVFFISTLAYVFTLLFILRVSKNHA